MAFAEEKYVAVNGDGTPTPMTKQKCEELVKTDSEFKSLIQYDTYGCYYDGDDYWAGAVYACKEQGMHLPSQSELEAIAGMLGCTSSGCPTPTVSPYKELWEAGGGGFQLWSSVPYSNSEAYEYDFFANVSYDSFYIRDYTPSLSAVCVR